MVIAQWVHGQLDGTGSDWLDLLNWRVDRHRGALQIDWLALVQDMIGLLSAARRVGGETRDLDQQDMSRIPSGWKEINQILAMNLKSWTPCDKTTLYCLHIGFSCRRWWWHWWQPRSKSYFRMPKTMFKVGKVLFRFLASNPNSGDATTISLIVLFSDEYLILFNGDISYK